MSLSSIFKIRKEATPGILDLLTKTTLGTNGAKYKHLDTRNRILEADNPLFLSMERNDKVIGNVTFCQRGESWYIRYFAFDSLFQSGSSNNRKQSKGNDSFLKRELSTFFDKAFNGDLTEKPVKSMYAYIDPKNERSKWMSENFGFKVIAQLATQSFSRLYPKKSKRLEKISDWSQVKDLVDEHFGKYKYYFITHAEKGPFYILRDDFGEIFALTKVTRVNWEIIQLPGKFGKQLTKLIPYIPFINKLIKPKRHTFLVPEIVFAKDNSKNLLEELFTSVLASEKLNLILWWIDNEDPFYNSIRGKVNWGLLHKILGVTPVDVVEKKSQEVNLNDDEPVFVIAYDMV